MLPQSDLSNHGRISFSLFNMRDPLVPDVYDGKKNQQNFKKRADSISFASRKKFTEDLEVKKVIASPKRTHQVRKPLPTLKSLAKENKKLQRLLRISLNQREEGGGGNIGESVAGNFIHVSDSTYNNTSFGSEIKMNTSIAPDSPISVQKSRSSKRL